MKCLLYQVIFSSTVVRKILPKAEGTNCTLYGGTNFIPLASIRLVFEFCLGTLQINYGAFTRK